jgi:predicted Rossmann fold nucleotide-binding protein DprA/Smf involved in DNA uptake
MPVLPKHAFLMRNATMSGYGLATVVVEAGETSGARARRGWRLSMAVR